MAQLQDIIFTHAVLWQIFFINVFSPNLESWQQKGPWPSLSRHICHCRNLRWCDGNRFSEFSVTQFFSSLYAVSVTHRAETCAYIPAKRLHIYLQKTKNSLLLCNLFIRPIFFQRTHIL